jgi:hypothetical protein
LSTIASTCNLYPKSQIINMPANNAVNVNPTIGVPEHITWRGSSWLWAVFCLMAFTDLIVFVWMTRVPRGQRVFHQLCLIVSRYTTHILVHSLTFRSSQLLRLPTSPWLPTWVTLVLPPSSPALVLSLSALSVRFGMLGTSVSLFPLRTYCDD